MNTEQQLRSALNAMLTQFGMDEDEWSKPTFDQARRALAAHPSAPAESGWRWVPVEPTDAMEVAAENDYEDTGATFPNWKSAYRSMLKAAPSAAQPGGEGA